MVRSPTMQPQHAGPAIAALFLVAVLVIVLALFALRTGPALHGQPGLSEAAREFLHRTFPAQPLPDPHPQVARPSDAPGGN